MTACEAAVVRSILNSGVGHETTSLTSSTWTMGVASQTVQDRLRVGFGLDHLWAESMGFPKSDTKERPLRLVAELLNAAAVPYAVIGGVAMQIRSADPRTTLDIDIAVSRFADVPHAALIAAGFEHTGRHAHSDNWQAPAIADGGLRTAVQFSAEDVGIAEAVAKAEATELADGLMLRVATPADLIVLKLAAAREPSRPPSKREHDIADIVALMEAYPSLRTPETLAALREVRLALLDLDSQ